MELDEIAKRKLNFEHLSELEGRPSEAGDPYLNMNRDELLEQLNFYRKLLILLHGTRKDSSSPMKGNYIGLIRHIKDNGIALM